MRHLRVTPASPSRAPTARARRPRAHPARTKRHQSFPSTRSHRHRPRARLASPSTRARPPRSHRPPALASVTHRASSPHRARARRAETHRRRRHRASTCAPSFRRSRRRRSVPSIRAARCTKADAIARTPTFAASLGKSPLEPLLFLSAINYIQTFDTCIVFKLSMEIKYTSRVREHS